MTLVFPGLTKIKAMADRLFDNIPLSFKELFKTRFVAKANKLYFLPMSGLELIRALSALFSYVNWKYSIHFLFNLLIRSQYHDSSTLRRGLYTAQIVCFSVWLAYWWFLMLVMLSWAVGWVSFS